MWDLKFLFPKIFVPKINQQVEKETIAEMEKKWGHHEERGRSETTSRLKDAQTQKKAFFSTACQLARKSFQM